ELDVLLLEFVQLLLHLIDISDTVSEAPEASARAVVKELETFDPSLISRPCWLVFTKADTHELAAAEIICRETCEALHWTGPWFLISGVSGYGCQELCQKIWLALQEMPDGDC
ncbi:MAG: hypothetical protein VW257_11555, partial [Quisquiliibacterium sp.]